MKIFLLNLGFFFLLFLETELHFVVIFPSQANIRAQQRASFKKITEQVKRKQPLEKMSEESMYFDPRVKQEMTSRNRKVFKFNEPGELYLEH